MATFYILPARERLEHEITAFWGRTLPGLDVPAEFTGWFLERIEHSRPDAYFLHREDLPGVGELGSDLIEYFGATRGDEVVEINGSGPVRRQVV